VVAPVCVDQVAGLGADSYVVGLERLVSRLRKEEQ
jgi:3-dehydroquinate dehydratase